MKKSLILAGVMVLLLVTLGVAGAATVTVPAADTVTVDGTEYALVSTLPDASGLMWESVEGGGYKACLCMMTAFRALQAVGQFAGITDFTSAQTQITTGWNTDGPEELYEKLGWVEDNNFFYAIPITGGAYLTLADAWYDFTIGGVTYQVALAEDNYQFNPPQLDGYVEGWDFFDYRTAFKNGTATEAQAIYFKNYVQAQIIDNFVGETHFEVTAVPLPGAVWLLGTGLVGLIGLRRKRVRQ